MNTYFKENQILTIEGIRYTVMGLIWFQEDTWEWQEYMVCDAAGKVKWLNVEEEDGHTIYSLYEECYVSGNSAQEEIRSADGQVYRLVEQGKAIVKKYYGRVDVDRNERCVYKEYANEDKNQFIAFENWEGEIEKSKGYRLNEYDVIVTDTYANSYINTNNMRIKISGRTLLGFGSLIVFFVIIVLKMLDDGMEMSAYIEENVNFVYVTSVTSQINSEKAKVYSTSLTVDAAVKSIIDGSATNVSKIMSAVDTITTKTTEEEMISTREDDGIGVRSSKEYAYVYTSQNGETYVQISSLKFIGEEEEDAYHARTHHHHYSRTFRSNNTISKYSSYLNSARESSVGSRGFSGGGISAGK